MFTYNSIAEIVEAAKAEGKKISQLVLEQQTEQTERSRESLFEEMERNFTVMIEAAQAGSASDIRSTSGLTGGDAFKMKSAIERGKTLCGGMFTKAVMQALAVSEFNAAMGRIVAAPTAGSCGILPGALLSMRQEHNVEDGDCVMSMFTAAAVGMVIAENACIAGAQGGCQAECGSASAMAAAALVELAGGTPEMVGNAVAIALKNVLGLVCDPVAGLVEIPCIKRNAGGVANALCAAEMALAGIESKIPPDEVVIAMRRIGDSMSASLKETADGGLAVTPTGLKLQKQVFG